VLEKFHYFSLFEIKKVMLSEAWIIGAFITGIIIRSFSQECPKLF
jgi:hypothetical protein